jgi:16S rRNA G966 N2-methylase RsmD
MEPELLLQANLNIRFALRKHLVQKRYHLSETSVPKDDLTPEKEPYIRMKLSKIAKQIIDCSNTILVDTYTCDERAKDWLSLQKKIVIENGSIINIDTRTRPGHKILDHFMPHFYDVKNYKGMSVRNLFSQESIEKALLQNLQMHSTPYKSEIRRMIVMTGGLGNVTKYRTVTSKAIVQYYQAKRVLDPCTGWGGRMLGSLAASDSTFYVGCEPDPNTAKGLRGILEDTAIPLTVRSRGKIIEKPAELSLSEVADMEKFDLVLTSPPYFNLELYTAGDQSTVLYKKWEDWTEKWLKVVILGCLKCLKENGVSCWSVKNFKSDKKYPLADITKKIHKDAGWELVKTVCMTGSGRPGAKRIEDGEEKRGSEEETFCFKKSHSSSSIA